ncbi:MAG: ABC transporter substrate-binding protein [Pseudomonadota bacterium]
MFWRRRFLLATGSLLAARLVHAQQQGRNYRVGALFVGGAAATELYRSALRDRLATHGFVEGRNLKIDAQGAAGMFHEDRNVVREMVAAKPDAIFTCSTGATEAAQAATKSVPIVFVWVDDPVATGLVKSYARPGGNVTGVTNRFGELLVKRLELARELVPRAKRVAVVGGTLAMQGKEFEAIAPALRKAAAHLGVELLEIPPRGIGIGDDAIARARKAGAEVLLPFAVFSDQLVAGEQVVQLTNQLRIPTIFADAEMVERGGLISYGTNLVDDVRRGADQLARVLKGAKPAELPVDQAARFEMVVNLKTAKDLGIRIPQSVLVRADRVIE